VEKTVTRAMLGERVADATGLSKQDTALIGERMFELIGSALKRGESVKLSGFGTFDVRTRAERVGRNPRTGEEHRIAPHQTVVLIPSARLRDALDSAQAKTQK